MANPTEVPDFYGYGSDITVNLTTGETRMRGKLPRKTWRDCLGLVRLVLFLPWLLAEGVRCWCGLSRPWLGQIECVTKDRERKRLRGFVHISQVMRQELGGRDGYNDNGHITGCDCGECAKYLSRRMLEKR